MGRGSVEFAKDFVDSAEIRMNEMERNGMFFSERCEARARNIECGYIGVDADQCSAGSDLFDDRRAVSAGAEGRVYGAIAGFERQCGERLAREHADVGRRGQVQGPGSRVQGLGTTPTSAQPATLDVGLWTLDVR